MSFPRYPKYKASGVEWLGQVPEGWEVKRSKFIFNIGRGRVISQDELIVDAPYPVYSSQTLDDGCLGFINTYDFDCSQITWTTDGANAGTVFLRRGKHNCTNVCGTLLPKTDSQHLEYTFYFLQYATQFYKRPDTNGAKIMNGEMAGIYLALPPLPEQTAIAEFLDRETGKIDELVAEQRRLMELLKEKRQAVISHAVTKGLNPHAPMKPSGIEWLGDVPEHWEVAKTSYFYKVAMGQTILAEDLIEHGEWPVFSATDGDHYFGRINEPNVRLNVGDIVIPARGNSIGSVKLVTEPATTTQTTIYCKPLAPGKLNANFVYQYFRGCKASLFYFTQTAIPQITVREVNSNAIVIPPISEQTEIVAFLDIELAKFDTLTAEARRAIDLLQERRTALISAAVTGQIDVRKN